MPSKVPIVEACSAALDATDVSRDLRVRSLRGGLVTLAGQPVKLVLQLGSTMVLARLLTPSDFGLVAMVTAVIGFFDAFKDAGLGAATVQREDVTHAQVSNLFAVNAAFGLGLAGLAAALAPAVAWFFGEPRLVWVMLALAPSLLIGALAVQHRAVLARRMRFAALVGADVLGLALGILAAIVLAVRGAGYWALVALPLTTSVTTTALAWWASDWRPGWPSRGTGVRPMLAFGGHLTVYTLFDYWYRNLDNILVARFWGPAALGFYSRAYNILNLPVGSIAVPIGSVAVPTLSRLAQDAERHAATYLAAVRATAWLFLPILAVLLVGTADVVAVVLGPGWMEVAPLLRALGVAGLLVPLGHSTGWLMVSRGQTDRMMRWGIFATSVSALVFLLTVPHGVRALALGYGVSGALLSVLALWYATRGSALGVLTILRVMLRPLAAAGVASAIYLGLGSAGLLGDLPAVVRLLVLGLILCAAAAVGLVVTGEWRALQSSLRR